MDESLSKLEIVKILEAHRRYCEKQALNCLIKPDFHNAVRYQAKAEDTISLINIVEARIKELREVKNE